jgi:hypothetical protein
MTILYISFVSVFYHTDMEHGYMTVPHWGQKCLSADTAQLSYLLGLLLEN